MRDEFTPTLIAVLIAGIAFTMWIVHNWGREAERKQWCRHVYEDITSYEKCLKTPDWEKK